MKRTLTIAVGVPLILVALLVLYADANRTSYYLDAALVLSLLAFVATLREAPDDRGMPASGAELMGQCGSGDAGSGDDGVAGHFTRSLD